MCDSDLYILDVQATIDLLAATNPLPPMTVSAELELAAIDHCNDTEVNGLVGHIGTDGTSTSHRIKKYANWDFKIGENIRYGNDTARDCVIAWLVDDNKPNRSHRNNILQLGNSPQLVIV